MNRLALIVLTLLIQGCFDSDSANDSKANHAGRVAPTDFETLHVVIFYGQSLSVGAKGLDLISTLAPYDNDVLMFDGDSTIDIRMGLPTLSEEFQVLDPQNLTGFQNLRSKYGQGAGNRGQTSAESLGHSLASAARNEGGRWHGLFYSAGLGAMGYEGLKQGTGPYNNLLIALTRAKELAENQGLKVNVDAVAFVHGESDSKNTNYYDSLIEIQKNLDSDIRLITEQQGSVVLLMNQPSSFYSSGVEAAKAIYRAHKDSEVHVLVAPNYDLDYSNDLVHLSSPGYFMLGERFSEAFIKTIWESSKWEPLAPESIVRSGTEIVIQYKVPTGEIEIDTLSVEENNQYGFEFHNEDAGEIRINSIVKSGPDELTLILDQPPEAGLSVLKYGLSGHSKSRNTTTIPRGNIRDTSDSLSEYQYRHLYNWGVHFEEVVK